MLTRREALRNGMGLAAILAAGKAPAYLLGARGVAFGRRYTAKDYVQDGLIAMWDGIENAGWGTHSVTAKIWKDLVGNKNFTLVSPYCVFNDNSLVCESHTSYGAYNSGTISPISYEVCFVANSSPNLSAGEVHLVNFNNVQGLNVVLRNDVVGVGYVFDTFTSPRYYANGLSHTGMKQTISCVSNNIFQNSNKLETLTANYSFSTDYYMTINGRHNYQGNRSQDFSKGFNGYIYCIRAYSRVITASEISSNYAIDKVRFNLP